MVSEERNFKKSGDGSFQLFEYAKPITIGDNVWVCGDVTINAGVTIGNDMVIGSGNVVTKNIPSGILAAGVPCRIIREVGQGDRSLDPQSMR